MIDLALPAVKAAPEAVKKALVAHAGTRADASGMRAEALQAALRAGAQVLGIDEKLATVPALDLATVQGALDALRTLAPLQKAMRVRSLSYVHHSPHGFGRGVARLASAGLCFFWRP